HVRIGELQILPRATREGKRRENVAPDPGAHFGGAIEPEKPEETHRHEEERGLKPVPDAARQPQFFARWRLGSRPWCGHRRLMPAPRITCQATASAPCPP